MVVCLRASCCHYAFIGAFHHRAITMAEFIDQMLLDAVGRHRRHSHQDIPVSSPKAMAATPPSIATPMRVESIRRCQVNAESITAKTRPPISNAAIASDVAAPAAHRQATTCRLRACAVKRCPGQDETENRPGARRPKQTGRNAEHERSADAWLAIAALSKRQSVDCPCSRADA